MKRRFSLFTYPMMDMKAAEAELNRRAFCYVSIIGVIR